MSVAAPPFSLLTPRYDQSTFLGRLRHFADVIDPSTLLTSRAELERALELLRRHERGEAVGEGGEEALWRAKKIKDAMVHPDTGEVIPMPFRMSGFVPFGTPIVAGMLLFHQTLPATLFWQALNQTHNALVNYSNRNASAPTSTADFAKGYVGAVLSAMAVAGGLGEFIKRTGSLSPSTKAALQRFIPYPAVATANTCNVLLMRRSELSTGISVTDAQGNHLAFSKEAAKKAIFETALTRIFLPAPILVLPPLIMGWIEKSGLFQRVPRLRLPVQVAVVTAAFGTALPVAISLFPQTGSLPVSELEPHLRHLPHSAVFYNKGL